MLFSKPQTLKQIERAGAVHKYGVEEIKEQLAFCKHLVGNKHLLFAAEGSSHCASIKE